LPFDFMRRKKEPPVPPVSAEVAPTSIAATPGVPFDGMTEDWRLVGRMLVEGRLSDALNRRAPIALTDVQWAPMDGSEPMTPAPGLRSVDPYDLVLVITGEDSLPVMTDAERTAHKVHKVSYEVGLEVPPYRVIGTVMLYPGYEPARLLDRSSEMFVPVVNATATMAGRAVSPSDTDVILVNRAYLRGVEQVDARTGERHEKLPGGSLGGAQWSDKGR
jgi:hypothetical protein